MWKRIKSDFDAGVEKVKWFSTLLNERVKIEISLFKLFYKSSEMEKEKACLMKNIGERVYEMKRLSGKPPLKDESIAEIIKKAEVLDADIEGLRKKISDIDRPET